MSRQLRATLRLWRRYQSTVWLKKAQSRPAWAFASTAGTAPDESKVRKAFNQILDKAGLHRLGPHQMRHTFGSLLISVGGAREICESAVSAQGFSDYAARVCALAPGRNAASRRGSAG